VSEVLGFLATNIGVLIGIVFVAVVIAVTLVMTAQSSSADRDRWSE
jgi:hypothetical protein